MTRASVYGMLPRRRSVSPIARHRVRHHVGKDGRALMWRAADRWLDSTRSNAGTPLVGVGRDKRTAGSPALPQQLMPTSTSNSPRRRSRRSRPAPRCDDEQERTLRASSPNTERSSHSAGESPPHVHRLNPSLISESRSSTGACRAHFEPRIASPWAPTSTPPALCASYSAGWRYEMPRSSLELVEARGRLSSEDEAKQ